MKLSGFKVVTLTDAAADRVKQIIAKAEWPIVGVRVGVKNGGCAGMSYTMEYAESINPLDEVVEDKGVTVLIDPKAVLFLGARDELELPAAVEQAVAVALTVQRRPRALAAETRELGHRPRRPAAEAEQRLQGVTHSASRSVCAAASGSTGLK